MSESATWLTQEAYDRLTQELEHLSGPARAEIVARISAARDEGDLKENGGYHAAREEQAEAARALSGMFGCAVLVKGGHGAGGCAEDVLFDGERAFTLSSPRVDDPLSTHGTGCSLSAAITASLACGRTLLEAVTEAKAYVYGAIRAGMQVGEAVSVLGVPEKLPTEEIRVESF